MKNNRRNPSPKDKQQTNKNKDTLRKMSKSYSILRKKLRELESDLHSFFSLPTETPIPQDLYEETEQRFVFINNLLSAENASHPTTPPHLNDIAHRLAELKQDFHDWESFTTTSALHQVDDNASTCLCTETCLNEDGEGFDRDHLGSPVSEDPEKALVEFSGGFNEDKSGCFQAELLDCSVEEKVTAGERVRVEVESDVVKKEQGRGVGFGRLCVAMACGVVIGMALMGFVMERFCGCFLHVKGVCFLSPT